jgi:myo-inositol-1(or 4)-monophosphatase
MQTREALSPEEINHVVDVITNRIIPISGPFIRTIYEKNKADKARLWMQGEEKTPGSGEPSSKIDVQVTSLVRSIWLPEFPDYPILAEDFEDPALANLTPEQIIKLPGVLVLDGIDGSGRMLRGSDYFSSSYGFMSQGKIMLGVLHQPVGNHIWTAQEGTEGAFADGQRMHLSTITNLNEATGTTAYAWDRNSGGTRDYNLALLRHIGRFLQQPDISGASSALDIEGICKGESDVHLSLGLKPWDVGASPYHAEKLGAIITDINGNPWNIFTDNILVTNNLQIHSQMVELIKEARVAINEERMLKELLEELKQENADLRQTNARLRRWKGLGAVIDTARHKES